ncbi:hypothetical protein D3C76_1722090 [compost metagenome]
MATADAVADEFTLVENWLDEGYVVDVGAAPVGVVDHQHVAFKYVVLADAAYRFFGAELHRSQVYRAVGGLADQLQVCVIDRVGKVQHVRQDW